LKHDETTIIEYASPRQPPEQAERRWTLGEKIALVLTALALAVTVAFVVCVIFARVFMEYIFAGER